MRNGSWPLVRRSLVPSLVLALSVACPVAGFTVMSALWWKPLPVAHPDRLVMVLGAPSGGQTDDVTFDFVEESDSWSIFEDAAAQVVTSGDLGGARPRIVLRDVGKQVESIAVSSGYFRVLGVSIRGRDFSRADNRIGAEPVAIISDDLWSASFKRDPGVIGTVVPASPIAVRIIGVASSGFTGARRGERADMWIPANLVPRVSGLGDVLEDALPTLVLARLKPGQTRADATQLLLARASTESGRNAMGRIRLVPLTTVFGAPDIKTTVISEGLAMTIVGVVAGFVLLAGCTTLMSLVLVGYERRRREFQVRAAIGASRLQIVRLITGELAPTAVFGSIGGLLLATLTVAALPTLRLPGGVDLTRLDMSLDWRVVSMALATGAVTLLMAASVAFIRFRQSEVTPDLLGSRVISLRSSHRLRQWLLGCHVFVTSVVLILAGLFIRSVSSAFDTGAGFDVDRTVFVDVQLLPPLFESSSNTTSLQELYATRRERLENGLRALPGITDVAAGPPPLGPASLPVATRTFETDNARRELAVGVMTGSAELSRALGLSLLQGRHLQLEDRVVRPQPIVITQKLARLLWPGDDPVGKVVTQTVGSRSSRSVVVGVIADVPHESIAQPIDGVVVTVSPLTNRSRYVVRSDRPDEIVVSITQLISEVASDAPLIRITTGRQLVANDLGRQRLGAWFLSGSGVVSLILGAGGVFALVAYLANTRRRDYGVRIALGGSVASVTLGAAGAGIFPALIGAAAGEVCAFGLAGVIRSLLPGVGRVDPPTYLGVLTLLIVAACAASFAGAGRLRSLSPAEVLRVE